MFGQTNTVESVLHLEVDLRMVMMQRKQCETADAARAVPMLKSCLTESRGHACP
jgi:hypothetical protein